MTTSPRALSAEMITIPDRNWRLMAACRHAKPEPFFPAYHSLRLGCIRGSGRQAVQRRTCIHCSAEGQTDDFDRRL